MKCSGCGADIPDKMRFCGVCGKAVPSDAVVLAVSSGEPKNRYCLSCGRGIDWNVNVCPHCGYDFRLASKDQGKDYLVVGGVLTILASVISIVLLSIMVISTGHLATEGVAMALLLYSCAGLGIMGGLLALVRKKFPLAVLGSACAIFGLGFFFGIPGLMFTVRSSRQFEDR